MIEQITIDHGRQGTIRYFPEFFQEKAAENFSKVIRDKAKSNGELERRTCSQCGSHDLESLYAYTNRLHPVRRRVGWYCMSCGYEYDPLKGTYLTKEEFRILRKKACAGSKNN